MVKIKQILTQPLLAILRWAAQRKLAQLKPRIVGVTGSMGKSSFTYLLDIITKDSFQVRTTAKGNSQTGLPLEILGIREKLTDYSFLTWLKIILAIPAAVLSKQKDYNLLIAEMGVDSPFEPNNMSYLLKIVQPDIGVLLNIAPVHTEQFSVLLKDHDKDNKERLLDLIAQEKGKIITTLSSDQTAIINIDYPAIQKLIPQIKAKTITIGKSPKTDYRLVNYQVSKSGTKFTFHTDNQNFDLKLENTLLFEEYGLTILAVLAAAEALGLNIADSITKIEQDFHLPPGRLSIISGKKDSLIIDSSYNSSPDALAASLNLLNLIKTTGQKIVVLGDMRELGPFAEVEHQKIAQLVKKMADVVILVGPLSSQFTYPELLKVGFPKDKILTFTTSLGVGQYLVNNILHKEDLILVKGSQNTIFLEQVVFEMMSKPSDAEKLLCRQSRYWDKQRKSYFTNHPQLVF